MKPSESSFEEQLTRATDLIIASESRKKLIVSGPGTGKTFAFVRLLEKASGTRKTRLALTFLKYLRDDLNRGVGDLCEVRTFHGYCSSLLRAHEGLRGGLSVDFEIQPRLATLIEGDWGSANSGELKALLRMRNLEPDDHTDFYLERSGYYDAVDFDDSVFRAYVGLNESTDLIPRYDIVLVDEYQDFNRLEKSFLALLSSVSPCVIAGDDDQAVYNLRGSSCEHIRELARGGEYKVFELPFCMRSTKVIVEATNDILKRATEDGFLIDRLTKPYRYYPPKKEADSKKYPKIVDVSFSTQAKNTNYMGRLVACQVDAIKDAEIEESHANGFPTVLVIAEKQYRDPIQRYLESKGYQIEVKSDLDAISRDRGLELLRKNPSSNLGLRICLEIDMPAFRTTALRESVETGKPLAEILPADYVEQLSAESTDTPAEEPTPTEQEAHSKTLPTIRLTSFEGSKGLSAQHVFIVPPNRIDNLAISRFLVAVTRTRKCCYLMHARRFAGIAKDPPHLLSWIKPERKRPVYVNKEFWNTKCVEHKP